MKLPFGALACVLALSCIGTQICFSSGTEGATFSATGLCPLFGGICCQNCTVSLRHRWNISLCGQTTDLCCVPATCSRLTALTSDSEASNSAARSTECGERGGVCQPWYSSCSGGKTRHSCTHLWQSCCTLSASSTGPAKAAPLPATAAPPYSPASAKGSLREQLGLASGQAGVLAPPEQGRAQNSAGHGVLGDEPFALQVSQLNNNLSPFDSNIEDNECAADYRPLHQASSSKSARWPWIVSLESDTGVAYCTGLIVSKHWVLAPASCFKGMSDLQLSSHRVAIGDSHGNETEQLRTYAVSDIVKHHLYNEDLQEDADIEAEDKGPHNAAIIKRKVQRIFADIPKHCVQLQHTQTHDLALIRVSTAIAFDNDVSPACLPEHENRLDENTCFVAGLFKQSHSRRQQDEGIPAGMSAPTLRQLKGSLLSSEACSKLTGLSLSEDTTCFEEHTDERVVRFQPGASVMCRIMNGGYATAGIATGNVVRCHDKSFIAVTAAPANVHWVSKVINKWKIKESYEVDKSFKMI